MLPFLLTSLWTASAGRRPWTSSSSELYPGGPAGSGQGPAPPRPGNNHCLCRGTKFRQTPRPGTGTPAGTKIRVTSWTSWPEKASGCGPGHGLRVGHARLFNAVTSWAIQVFRSSSPLCRQGQCCSPSAPEAWAEIRFVQTLARHWHLSNLLGPDVLSKLAMA